MTVPSLTEEDIATLWGLTSDLDFSDAERRTVLLENASRDVNAAPGSGKTTVLAAKLLLLAKKWPFARQGICVLSHTNVARDEIEKRLSATADGARLLAHPHFIGTIHSFIDRFLALPLLRSEGISVDVIDDDAFANRAIGMAMKNGVLRAWAQNNEGVLPMVAGLIFRGPDLLLASEGGSLPGPQSKSYPILQAIKVELTGRGVFRYADMFAFAELLLRRTPDLKERLSKRFPLVFIDEMQDTSREQEALLGKLFNASVVLQRFGDTNQRIFSLGDNGEKLTFPKADALSISTSKRFGPAIAAAVSGARVSGNAVVGEAGDVHQPMLMIYATSRVKDVVGAFGQEVLARFSDEELKKGAVRAVCTRKQGDAKQEPGRSLQDYWPAYVDHPKGAGGRSDRFWALLAQDNEIGPQGLGLHDRAADAKRAVLLALRAAASPHVSNVRDGPQLIRRLQDAGLDTASIRELCRDLALSQDLGATEASRIEVPGRFFEQLRHLLPNDMTREKFCSLELFTAPAQQPFEEARKRVCEILANDRRVEIQLGTVASMKGETHLATLVLESLGHPSRRFDLAEVLPVVAGLSPRDPKLKESVLSQFRNLYVAMSRPTSFLCVAANLARVTPECVAALEGKGWVVTKLA